MKKGYFVFQLPESDIANKSNGVAKKITSQIAFFNFLQDVNCSYVSLVSSGNKFKKFFKLFNKSIYKSYLKTVSDADFLYVRAIIPNTVGLLEFLKDVKTVKPSCKILYEIPTFPYDAEMTSFKQKLFLFLDKINRRKLCKYVDRIVTLTEDDEIFKCPTIKIKNGTDCNSIDISNNTGFNSDKINLIAVAQFAFWHGYDRLIEGLRNYKKDNVILHLVGNGQELEKYRCLVEQYGLQKQVLFHGALFGKDLSRIFDIADVCICSLGSHRKGLFVTSELKSREYLARGLPIVTSINIDIIPDDFPYCLKVPEDDSPIDIDKVVDFVTNLYSNNKREAVKKEIRSFAEKYCSMEYAMKNVKEYILKS